jgi:hypothetical protein
MDFAPSEINPVAVDGLDVAGLVKGAPNLEKVLLDPLAIHADPVVPELDDADTVIELNRNSRGSTPGPRTVHHPITSCQDNG